MHLGVPKCHVFSAAQPEGATKTMHAWCNFYAVEAFQQHEQPATEHSCLAWLLQMCNMSSWIG